MKTLGVQLVCSLALLVGLAPLRAPLLLGAEPASQRQRLSFQHGVNGYRGTVDVEIWAVSPNTCLEGNPNASSDADNDGGESQILMRFEGIVSAAPGRIPPKSTIHSAILIVHAFDEGTTVYLHRMLVPWRRTETWASLVAGITADGMEAKRKPEAFTFGKISASTSEIPFDVTDSVQAWVNGEPNHGWVFINTGANGWDFYTSEFEDVKQRPKLIVEFTPASR
ncbi:MAG: DNRLRE domain-containing protein [Gemmataceae bacterium]|nr:DNRLRE domain-containing protein [Gemmataceae bacterium]